MNILFLDIDGVINTPMWKENQGKVLRPTFNFPKHGKANNWQACQWVSQFCMQFGYSIVVSSTWRIDMSIDQLRDLLYNSGINKKIAIIGKTPYIKGQMRGYEIEKWIMLHSNLIHLNKFLIFDDDADMVHPELMDRLVQTRLGAGFMEEEFVAAIEKHRAMRKWSGFAPRPEQLTIWTVPLLTDEYEEVKDLTRTEKTVIIVA